jgi:hypothetical protein
LLAFLLGLLRRPLLLSSSLFAAPDKKCQIVEKRPTDTKMVIVGDKAYVSRDEAQKQLTVVCEDDL